jgi:hypothetical protein
VEQKTEELYKRIEISSPKGEDPFGGTIKIQQKYQQ